MDRGSLAQKAACKNLWPQGQPVPKQCQSHSMGVNLWRDLFLALPWASGSPETRANANRESRRSDTAGPPQGTSVGGWLLGCEEIHSRQGPGKEVRQLLGLGAFCSLLHIFFASYPGLAGVGWCDGACIWNLTNLFLFFPGFQQFIENRGLAHFL